MSVIYHIALAADWEQALRDGRYTISTRGLTLAEQGFIHASGAHQVAPVPVPRFMIATVNRQTPSLSPLTFKLLESRESLGVPCC